MTGGSKHMDFTIENVGHNTYLVYEAKGDDIIDSVSLRMLTNNKIHGLAQTIFTQIDNQKLIKYNISSNTPDEIFEKKSLIYLNTLYESNAIIMVNIDNINGIKLYGTLRNVPIT